MSRPTTPAGHSLPLADNFVGTDLDPTLVAAMRQRIRDCARDLADERLLAEAILGDVA